MTAHSDAEVRREKVFTSVGDYSFMHTKHVDLERGTAVGIVVEMPNFPLVIVRAKKGYAMCGYLNMAAANKMGDVAAKVFGVRTVEDVLAAKVVEVSTKAAELGAKEGMTGREFLNLMM
ncbi:MAG: DUF1805 domain-containing protein [Methanobacteriota archaeon]